MAPARRPTHPPAGADPPRPPGVLEPYEVFRQEKEGDPMRHGGSVLAPDATLAVHYARELYGRRQESVRLWVVRRADVHDLEDPDLLQPPLDRSFKKPGGYVMRDKLEAARERAGTTKPRARPGGPQAPAPGRPVRRRPQGGSRPPGSGRSGRDPGPEGGPDPRTSGR